MGQKRKEELISIVYFVLYIIFDCIFCIVYFDCIFGIVYFVLYIAILLIDLYEM